ncbi:TOR1B-like protein, partial [Mya arenaria]
MKSKYFHFISATREFPHSDMISFYKITCYSDKLRDIIERAVKEYPRSLIVIDEMDKMPPGVIDTIKPYLDFYEEIGGVDYRKSTFFFLSNTAGTDIAERTIKYWSEGTPRENIRLKEMEKVIRLPALNEKENGLVQTGFYATESVVPDSKVQEIADELKYYPQDLYAFSSTGCKRILDKITLYGDVIQYEGDVNQCEGDVNQCEGDVNQCEGDVNQYKDEVNQYEGDVNQYEGDMNQYEGDVNQCEGDVNQCEGDVNQYKGDYDGDVNKYEGDVKQYEGDVNNYEGDVNQYEGDVNKYEGDVNQYKDKVNQYEGNMNQYEGDVNQYEGDVNQYKGDVNQYQVDVNQYKGDVNQYEGDVNQYDGDVNQYEGDMNQYEGDVNQDVNKKRRAPPVVGAK